MAIGKGRNGERGRERMRRENKWRMGKERKGMGREEGRE